MKAILRKLSSSHQNLRTSEISGETEKLPVVGEPFVLIGEPLELGDVRVVITTEIETITIVSANEWEFKTKNSHYSVSFPHN